MLNIIFTPSDEAETVTQMNYCYNLNTQTVVT